MKTLLSLLLFLSITCFGQYKQANTIPIVAEENFGKTDPNQAPVLILHNGYTASMWKLIPNDTYTPASATVKIHPSKLRYRQVVWSGTGGGGMGGSILLNQIVDLSSIYPFKFSDIAQRPLTYPSDWTTLGNKPTLYTTPGALKTALGTLTGTNRLDTASINGLHTTFVAKQAAIDARVLTVANVAALKTITGLSGQVARTRGYYTNSDGGENTYYWNASSTATKDSGFVIQPYGAGTGRWLALDQTVANVRKFGAKGDSTTNDLACVQNAANAKGKGVLLFPFGNFLLNGTLSISKNAQNDGSQSNYIIEAHGAKIVTTNSSSTPVLRIYNSKRLTIRGLEVVGTTAFEGFWRSSTDDCKFRLVTFGKNDTDFFNQSYWNCFYKTDFYGIEIYTGIAGNTSGLQSEFNSNNFNACNFRDTDYLIKVYGTGLAQSNYFYNCDYSNVGQKILWIEQEMPDTQLHFFGGYYDDYDLDQGFPPDLKGVDITIDGDPLAANISSTFTVKDGSKIRQNFSLGTVGNRLSSRDPSSPWNLFPNGDLRYGDAGFSVNGVLTKAIVADSGYYNKALKVTGNTIAETYFQSIPVPYDGVYALVIIGKNKAGTALIPVYTIYGADTTQLYTPISFPLNKYVVTGCSIKLKKGNILRISWFTENTSGNEFYISYAGLSFGKQGALGLVPHPDAEAVVSTASTTYNPASLTNATSTSTTITLQGAALGDFVVPSFNQDILGVTLTAYVSAANTVTCVFSNNSGSTQDIASGQLEVRLIKK